ncbi:MAG: YbjQ family protein [Gammaproteobacteria bacterium]|nr:YbjQ family protein [Gammaproteobacteria bacterium]
MTADLIVFVVLLALGYVFGQSVERRHYRSILRREQELQDVLTFSAKLPPQDLKVEGTNLVSGNVVVSVDYFKRFVAGLRALVGGRMRTYETLLDRARREAVLRMKQQARQFGADMIFNVKLETASISKGAKDSIGSVEVYAYGTAINTSDSFSR